MGEQWNISWWMSVTEMVEQCNRDVGTVEHLMVEHLMVEQ